MPWLRPVQNSPLLRLAAAITAGLGILLRVTFPEAPPSPQDLIALFALIATVSLAVWWSLGQAWRLRQVARFFRAPEGAADPER
jgi:hypothetical protein